MKKGFSKRLNILQDYTMKKGKYKIVRKVFFIMIVSAFILLPPIFNVAALNVNIREATSSLDYHYEYNTLNGSYTNKAAFSLGLGYKDENIFSDDTSGTLKLNLDMEAQGPGGLHGGQYVVGHVGPQFHFSPQYGDGVYEITISYDTIDDSYIEIEMDPFIDTPLDLPGVFEKVNYKQFTDMFPDVKDLFFDLIGGDAKMGGYAVTNGHLELYVKDGLNHVLHQKTEEIWWGGGYNVLPEHMRIDLEDISVTTEVYLEEEKTYNFEATLRSNHTVYAQQLSPPWKGINTDSVSLKANVHYEFQSFSVELVDGDPFKTPGKFQLANDWEVYPDQVDMHHYDTIVEVKGNVTNVGDVRFSDYIYLRPPHSSFENNPFNRSLQVMTE